jgi:TRAP-type C4-dicarboxylate transport system permease large subunit
MLLFALIIAALFIGLIAGAMVYFIHYNEYQHHLKGDRPFKESFKSAMVAFTFFFFLSLIIGIIIYYLFK